MRAVIRRLHRLEEMLVPQVDLAEQRLADLLRERRRRRLEEIGQSFEEEELDWGSLGLPPGTRLSVRETLRLGRQLRRKRDREREERARRAAEGGHDEPNGCSPS
jgi:hypothetical protein